MNVDPSSYAIHRHSLDGSPERGRGLTGGSRPEQAQLQRFEFKYLINESMARAMRQFVRCYLRPDEFSVTRPDYSYPVHSLYLDSPQLSLYQSVNNGDKNRFKLRVRFYDDGPDAPAFFEIKRRRNETIEKHRACVRRAAVRPLLQGEWPQPHHLAKPAAKHLFALQEFHGLMQKLNASPRSHVAYLREAWMSPTDNSMRVTFDRAVQCEPQFRTDLNARVGQAVTAFPGHVIFELKFTGRLPNWCLDLIRAFGLVRGSAAKYAEGISLLGEERVSNCGVELAVREAAAQSPHQSEPAPAFIPATATLC